MSRSIEYRVEEYTEVISGVTHLRKKLHIEQLDVFITILNSTIFKNTYKVLTLFLLKNEANQSQSSSYAPVLFITASKYFFSFS